MLLLLCCCTSAGDYYATFCKLAFLVGTSSLCFLERVFDGDNKLTSSFHGRFSDLVVAVIVPALVVVMVDLSLLPLVSK